MALIECKNINRYFGEGENRVHILKNVNLTVEKGDFVAIIGQSGSGKSTLMNILGLLDTPTSGTYTIAGTETSKMTGDELAAMRRKRFGFIFQRYNLLSSISARDNVALPSVYAGLDYDERSQRADMLLDKLGLKGKEKNKPSALSGGQQQRVSIARALMNGGEIIFADEPTGALDSGSGETVMEIIHELYAEGHTIIMVTHDPKIAVQANRVIEIKDGEIISDTSKTTEIKPSNVQSIQEKHGLAFYKDQFQEACKMSVQAIVAHKMRSLLTMLGIIIGIAAVVSVVALGKGSQEKILSDINSMGTNTITIFPGNGFGDRRAGRIRTLTVADGEAISKLSYVSSTTPSSSSSGTLTYRNTDLTASVTGAGEQFFDVRGLKLATGRLFDANDVKENAQVVVIDDNTVKKLFPDGADPLGKTVLFRKRPLTVIGTLEAENNSFGGSSDSLSLYTPYTTLMNQISGAKYVNNLSVKVKDSVDSQVAEKGITELLLARHGTEDFFMQNSDSIKQTIESTTGTMTMLISSIALISLVVGGIGVMNIMLVSVTERTKEIGVRMAIGARQSNILQQFLIEAILLCLIGGLSGVLISFGLAAVFNHFVSDFAMSFSTASIVGAVVCSTAIGVIFGYMPAKNASKLNPIDALAHD
ncbi:MacB family efflux pump subunit [Kingella negevensis]|uniref:Pyoverdine export ATP-binding/permease protein PvdT n=1 Tax=Kingella negevensis TaxID=1522312 RepID=A0A238TBV0_9NEIS|nr:MacB family efflux pump subunit [Kingella negevensis]MDK4684062.1 MacB family efflux pump subunit [Kingella negevensis]MDK4697377.1 MacB family efflux pump subunit [Kingella negevensis]MDK4706717.1 MacB family efflux pump subunit [Kingella negevensis]MDK4708976.1 MacB family efflux pump subunit [Kingella negevensis]SNB62058.1 Macrolide export ATP-binding/permease protein MacB [Kingella negevensis]